MSSVVSLNGIDQELGLSKKIVLLDKFNDGFLQSVKPGKKSRFLRSRVSNKKNFKHTGGLPEQLLCGAFAGVVSRTAVAPFDLIRTHLLASHGIPTAERTALGILSTILKRDGWKGLFRSNGINCLRVGPNKAIELCTFETLRRTFSQENHPLKNIASTVAGGAAGLAGTLTTYPLELIRTRISVQPHLYYGLNQAFRKIVQEEGIGALYRGLTPSLFGIFPYSAVNYFVYDSLRGLYRKATGRENVPTIPTLFFGACSGAVSSTFTFPLEVARRQLQLGAASGYGTKNAIGVVSQIYQQEGLLALYRGIGMTWLKLIPAAGISFVCYEAARVALGVDDASFARAARCNLPAKINGSMVDDADRVDAADVENAKG